MSQYPSVNAEQFLERAAAARSDRESLDRFRATALGEQVERLFVDAAERPFFAERLREAGLTPDSFSGLADLAKAPILEKEALREAEAARPPFGAFHAASFDRYVRAMMTGGTTGKSTHVLYTEADTAIDTDGTARAFARAGVSPGHVVSHPWPHGMVGSEMLVTLAVERTGALCLPLGMPSSEEEAIRHLEYWREVKPTYLMMFGPVLRMYLDAGERCGIRLGTDVPIESMMIAEAVMQYGDARAWLEGRLGARVHNLYGLKELQTILCTDCEAGAGQHLAEDLVVVEVLDADGAEVPAGERGRLVMTSLYRDSAMIRYATGDLGRVLTEPCECGEVSNRLYFEGRTAELMEDADGSEFLPLDVHRELIGLGVESDYDGLPEFRLVSGDDGRPGVDVDQDLVAVVGGTAIETRLAAAGIGGMTVRGVARDELPSSPYKLLRTAKR